MSIRDWPKNERPREKLIDRGAQALSEAELLAVLLGSGVRGHSAVELARHLLMEFGSLRALLTLERSRFMGQRGLGPTRYCLVQAALELGRRHFREAMCIGSVLTAPEATRAFLMTQLRDRAYEVFCCLHLESPSPDFVRGIIPRYDRRRERAPARSGETGSLAQRRGGHLRAQPPFRRRGAQRRG